jgi:hypothetical protein
MVGYKTVGNVIDYTENISNSYNSLQTQLNRRMGKFQWNLNYTFSRTIVFNNASNTTVLQFVNQELTKNVANRRHAINFNMGYDLRRHAVHRKLQRHRCAVAVLDRDADRIPAVPLRNGVTALPARRPIPVIHAHYASAGAAERRQLHAAAGQLAGHRQYAADAVLRPVVVEPGFLFGQDDPD